MLTIVPRWMVKELFETQEKIAGPLLMSATGEPVKVGDVIDQGDPPWRQATVLVVEDFDTGDGIYPVYHVQWKVIGDVPDDVKYRFGIEVDV